MLTGTSPTFVSIYKQKQQVDYQMGWIVLIGLSSDYSGDYLVSQVDLGKKVPFQSNKAEVESWGKTEMRDHIFFCPGV